MGLQRETTSFTFPNEYIYPSISHGQSTSTTPKDREAPKLFLENYYSRNKENENSRNIGKTLFYKCIIEFSVTHLPHLEKCGTL